MNNLFNLFGSRIRNKLALLSLIPVAVVAIVITWHTIESSRNQIENSQARIASQLAKNLATISDFALYSSRQDLLQPLADSAAEIPGVANILFLTPDRTFLLDPVLPNDITPEMISLSRYASIPDRHRVIEEPVYLVDVEVTDFPDREQAEKTLLGWVVVITDNTYAKSYTQDTIISHMLISLSVLLGAILLSFILSNNVVYPITQITHTVRELERGNLDARIVATTGDELAILANGINHLAKAVAEGRGNLENKVELATERLRKTLDDLQRKNRELDTARKEAESASAAKSEFLAHMSHELRTPITAILGFVNLLAASQLQPSQSRYCSIIQQASNQLLQLIDDILDITRLQSNAVILDKAPFNLAECVETPLSLMASKAHEKGLELILDISPNVVYELIGDSLRTRQIIYNLISNAIKFTPSGFVSLSVSMKSGEENNVTLVLQVADSGIGIPDKDRTKLFEAFSQADNSISRRFGGSGLGLSIVKRLVTLMEGSLALESSAGKGSCFTIELPMERRAAIEKTAPAVVSSVLLYDPFPESRQALEHRLSRYATTIESCEAFSDLEIGETGHAPEVIIYSAPVSYEQHQLEREITNLLALYNCPITVLTPATSTHRELNNTIFDQLQRIRFIDKPPLSTELERACSPVIETQISSADGAYKALNANILITEDNEFTRILLAAVFENSNCHLVLASSGQQAIDYCADQAFDLILMDVHMPEVNGLTALKTIRSNKGPNSITPVIMLTADILQQEENALFEAGASDLLFKPIDEQKLLSCVHKHLQKELQEDTTVEVSQGKRTAQRKLFTEEIAKLTGMVRAALTDKDQEAMRETIHQLLGIAGVYHMTYLERAVQALHQAVKAGNGNKMFAAMETLEHEVKALILSEQEENDADQETV